MSGFHLCCITSLVYISNFCVKKWLHPELISKKRLWINLITPPSTLCLTMSFFPLFYFDLSAVLIHRALCSLFHIWRKAEHCSAGRRLPTAKLTGSTLPFFNCHLRRLHRARWDRGRWALRMWNGDVANKSRHIRLCPFAAWYSFDKIQNGVLLQLNLLPGISFQMESLVPIHYPSPMYQKKNHSPGRFCGGRQK